MGQLAVIEHLTLDGVMQAPGRCDEDIRDNFAHGGWAVAGNDEVMAQEMGKGMTPGGSLLFGRRTYEDFAAYWPNQPDNPYTEVLNKAQKYVASTTLREPLPWANSTVIDGDAAAAVRALKQDSDTDIGVLGSGELVHTLAAHDLVDTYVLMIHPIVLGSGKRLFPGGQRHDLRLVHSVTTTTGVVLATYARASNGNGAHR